MRKALDFDSHQKMLINAKALAPGASKRHKMIIKQATSWVKICPTHDQNRALSRTCKEL
jgi:hypothetical protein